MGDLELENSNDDNEDPELAHWKRRALEAESKLEVIRKQIIRNGLEHAIADEDVGYV